MPGYLSFDLETSTRYDTLKIPLKGKANAGKFKLVRKQAIHGPSWKDPKNDFHTIIYGTTPDKIELLHNLQGFKRILPKAVGELLLDSHTIIGTNLKFDLGFIWHDVHFQRWLKKGGKVWDCQVAQYLLGGQRHQFPSLGEMQRIILGIKTKKDRISALYKKCIGADEIIAAKDRCPRVWKLYCEYGIEDGRTPMLIMQKQYKRAKAMNMLPIIELYNKYLLALTMIEINGIPVDMHKVEELHQDFSLKVVEYTEKAAETLKPYWTDPRLPELNINSTQHSSLLLFGGELTCEIVEKTGEIFKTGARKGQEKTKKVKIQVPVKGLQLDTKLTKESKTPGFYSTDKFTIENIYKYSENKVAHKYCKYLKLAGTYKQKISTYLNAMLYKSVDGVIRANYNNTETATSRLSASQPNLQNIPAHGEFGDLIQGLLVAPEGWTCASVDFSQLEVLCQAMLSNDPQLCNDIKTGVDFHVKRLCYIEPNYTYEEISKLAKVDKSGDWPEKRSKAKVISFQKAYGAAPESLAQQTGLPIELVKQIFEQEDLEYPMVKQFDENLANAVQRSAILSKRDHFADRHGKDSRDPKGVPRKFIGDLELLPIRSRDKKSFSFRREEARHVGFYRSPTGKCYAFAEYGSLKKDGDVFRYYKPTQMKNYAMQGTAGDVQAITTVAMFPLLLKHPDKVKLVNEIHDSKWFLIKNEYLVDILRKICNIMKSTSKLLNEQFGTNVPFDFDCEAKIGKNFAQMEVFKG